jgi:16S rRNA (adenine1518-N6/adenine1519-N6)-dimethyltransferase
VRGLSETDVRTLLKKYNIRPSKKRGQSFLTKQSVVRRIVDCAEISPDDEILEIGGGFGILSKALAKTAKHLTIIEIDKRLVQALKDILNAYDNVTIIQDDALKAQLPDVDKVVSNLPYSISSEVTFRILQEMTFERAVLMYQKEFARRFIAEPCTQQYSRLTVDISYLAHT